MELIPIVNDFVPFSYGARFDRRCSVVALDEGRDCDGNVYKFGPRPNTNRHISQLTVPCFSTSSGVLPAALASALQSSGGNGIPGSPMANFSPSFLWQLINTHQINYCLTCAKTYKYKHDLKRHVLYECTKEKNFHCEYCKKSYRRESYLKMHVCSYKKHVSPGVAPMGLNVSVQY